MCRDIVALGHPHEKWKAGQSVPVATRRSAPPWTESKGLREAFLRRAVGQLWPGSTMGSKRYDEPQKIEPTRGNEPLALDQRKVPTRVATYEARNPRSSDQRPMAK